jgi:hypothetical protein
MVFFCGFPFILRVNGDFPGLIFMVVMQCLLCDVQTEFLNI